MSPGHNVREPAKAAIITPRGRARAGFTMAELLVAMVITAILAGIAATLAQATHVGHAYSRGHSEATQHARVALQRIGQKVRHAQASKGHPGVAVVYRTFDGYTFPDTLVVWSPTNVAAAPTGQPLVRECLFYCCDPNEPNTLVELRAASDSRPIPLDDTINVAPWPSEIAAIKASSSTTKVVLTELVRTVATNSGTRVGAVRFERLLRPTLEAVNTYPGSGTAWSALGWPQSLHGTTTGLRQAWVRIELMLVPGEDSVVRDVDGRQAIPYVGSAELLYKVDAP